MSEFSTHRPGTFCWFELCTQEWSAAKTFYTELFQWKYDDQPIGDDCFYTMLQLEHADIAAMYQMEDEKIAQKVPSHWLSYIAVANVDETVEKARALGATVVAGPHSVGNAGRMALFFEPNGAMFAVWQGQEHGGAKRKNQPNSVCWNELASKNAQASRDFYTQLFGWQYQIQDMDGMPYTLFLQDGEQVAGMLEMTDEWGDMPAHWMVYFQVENCDHTLSNVEKLGGQVCVPATDIPDVGRFSVITDPQGGFFSVIEI